jgi:ureidoglycolate amidohydrolase
MPDRRDALCAAAKMILAIEKAARTSGAIDTVATVGICDVFPSAVNSIPSRVELSVDIRDTELRRRDGVKQAIETACRSIAAERQVSINIDLLNADASCRLRSGNYRRAFSGLPQAEISIPAASQPRLPRLSVYF